MNKHRSFSKTLSNDLIAGLVVFLVALPLCLGVALASNAPLISGVLTGIIGGLVVGFLSGSKTSVSGPAAGLTAVIAAQIISLGSFEAFLTAVIIAGFIQIILGICKMGCIASFFPASVIKGLLWSIGLILVLKQIPHLFGSDADPMGEESFIQPDHENTFSELLRILPGIHPGVTLIGILSITLLVTWDKIKLLKKSQVPGPLVVILFSILLNSLFLQIGGNWVLDISYLVQVPIADSIPDFFNFLTFPDFSILTNSSVYIAGITIAAVASLETLLNLEAVDKIDPLHRHSPPNRELLAQGVGNIVAGLIGGIPMTSVIVRSSVNINAGVKTKLSAIWHGLLLLTSVMLIPNLLNQIPLAALAAILLVTGLKLANPKTLLQMYREGKNQFFPFISTIVAIVFTDLLIGVIVGLATSMFFSLLNSIKRPIKEILENHTTGDKVLHIQLPNQLSFFNKTALEKTLKNIPSGSHVLLDASHTDYLDHDIINLITDFQNNTAQAQEILVSLIGFKSKYPQFKDQIQYDEIHNREKQASLTPEQVLEILQEGNARFRKGEHLKRDVEHQLNATSSGQFPMAVILSCIDSRSSVELIFDLSIGDVFSVRIAGNVIGNNILGSIEYGCCIAGAKVILVMGHTSCGAVKTSVDLQHKRKTSYDATGCDHLDSLIFEIQESIDCDECKDLNQWSDEQRDSYCNEISYRNVLRTMHKLRKDSFTLDKLVRQNKVAIVGAMYNINTAEVTFFQTLDSDASIANNQNNKTKLLKLLKASQKTPLTKMRF